MRRALFPASLPRIVFERDPEWRTPSEDECFALWDKYFVPEHIRAHSRMVSAFAVAVAEALESTGAVVHLPSVRACGLLHDLGKFYTIQNGGSHGQIGGAWVLNETRSPHIAQGVLHHVRWMWEIDETIDAWLLSYCIIYADKRVMHDAVVTLEERYVDLVARYGHTEEAKTRIAGAHRQGIAIEAALSRRAGIALHEYSFDSGRLVKRT